MQHVTLCFVWHISLDLKTLYLERVEILLRIVPNEQELKAYREYERERKPTSLLSEEDRFMICVCIFLFLCVKPCSFLEQMYRCLFVWILCICVTIFAYKFDISAVLASCHNHVFCFAVADKGGANQSKVAHNELYWQLLWYVSPFAAGMYSFGIVFVNVGTLAHTHPFYGPFSGTTRVSRYQKGKTNLDFTER